MNKKQMKQLGKKLEQQKSPDEWAVWIADQFSACGSTHEYLLNAYECPDLLQSSFHRPTTVCERLGDKNMAAYDHYRHIAYECLFRSHLALEINSYIDEFLESKRNRILLRLTKFKLYVTQMKLRSFTKPNDDVMTELEMSRSVVEICGEVKEQMIPMLDAIADAITEIQTELYGGRDILTRGTRKGMSDCRELAVLLRDTVGEHLPDSGIFIGLFGDDMRQSFATSFRDRWVSESRAHARARIYGDDKELVSIHQRGLSEAVEVPSIDFGGLWGRTEA